MNGAAVEQALARIEAALTRIEKVAEVPNADEALRARHDRLRAAVSHSLHQLDDLLSGHEP